MASASGLLKDYYTNMSKLLGSDPNDPGEPVEPTGGI